MKLGITCTFTTKDPKRRRGGRPTTTNVEANDADTHASSGQATLIDEPYDPGTTEEQSSHPDETTREQISSDIEDSHALIDEYFAKRNHYLPIFDKDAFKPDASGDNIQQVIVHLMICAAFQHRSADPSAGSSALDSRTQAEEHLTHALKHLARFADLKPEFRTVQALILLQDCLRKARKASHLGAFYTAATVRLVHLLGINNLDLQEGFSAKQRLEHIRAFWSLYILDRELSFLHDLPPLLQDGDIRVIDPRKFSDDSRGLVISIDGSSVVNLFTARQRLAVILGKIYSELWTFRGQYLPAHMRSASAQRLTSSLLEWKQEWFDIGPPQALTTQWPTSACTSIVRQYLLYFMALLNATSNEKRIPDTIEEMTKAVMAEQYPTFDSIKPALSSTVVDAARSVLQMALLIHLGDIASLM